MISLYIDFKKKLLKSCLSLIRISITLAFFLTSLIILACNDKVNGFARKGSLPSGESIAIESIVTLLSIWNNVAHACGNLEEPISDNICDRGKGV